MKFNKLIVLVLIILGSDISSSELVSFDSFDIDNTVIDSFGLSQESNSSSESKKPENPGYYFNKRKAYCNKKTDIIAIAVKQPDFKPVLIKYNKETNEKDANFGRRFGSFAGTVDIPTKAKIRDLELRVKPDTGSILVIDNEKGDIIGFNKSGKIIGAIKGKDEFGNVDSNLTMALQPFSSYAASSSSSSCARNLQIALDSVANQPDEPAQEFGPHLAAAQANLDQVLQNLINNAQSGDNLPEESPVLAREENVYPPSAQLD